MQDLFDIPGPKLWPVGQHQFGMSDEATDAVTCRSRLRLPLNSMTSRVINTAKAPATSAGPIQVLSSFRSPVASCPGYN